MTVTTAIAPSTFIAEQRAARVDLAAAFRWFARLNMHESVANHLSASVSADGCKFLINPRGRHFSRVTAGGLLLLDANDPDTLTREDAPDPTAWYLHARLHARLPHARCVMHLHSKYATALACLADSTLYPIDMNTMRFFGRVVLDSAFSGMALSGAEGDRVADSMGEGKSVLLLANHGVLVIGPSIAAAFDEMYYFERAAETLVTCYATGKPLRLVSEKIAALTEKQWRDYGQLAVDHLESVKAILDAEEPEYRH
ncbi:MAG TPA: class II aldolase/adducin family protein [Steroidobacteraceae bacterium]|nr:class II aldolase/adducin family protein [Steroidobacteraceae bacterium]